MTWSHSGGQDEIKTVELIIETAPADIDWNPRDGSNSGNCFIFSFLVLEATGRQKRWPWFLYKYDVISI